MSLHTTDNNEPSVDPGAFWHTNMDLYYGFIPGEVVEIAHEPNKYWLASIKYCFKHLVLLEWVGKYGDDFWVDTSMNNSLIGSSGTSSTYNGLKRLFPLGYHLGTQLKSKFKLEKPSNILLKPSLYNPSKDPYADIRTIEELLVHEIDDQNNDDAFAIKSTSDTANLVLAKCKTKINFGQEDQDELEAALLSLSGLEQCDETRTQAENPDQKQSENADGLAVSSGLPKSADSNVKESNLKKANGLESDSSEHNHTPSLSLIPTCDEKIVSKNDDEPRSGEQSPVCTVRGETVEPTNDQNGDERIGRLSSSKSQGGKTYQLSGQPTESCSSGDESDDETFPAKGVPNPLYLSPTRDPCNLDEKALDAKQLKLCKRLQICATNRGRYRGVHPISLEFSDQVYFCKPRQFYDIGGANQERLFVPGTLLEVCHTHESEPGHLDLRFWFAFVVKNVGGRLTLRWFLYDEPKFKQGRLELKSSKSSFIIEGSDQSADPNNSSEGDNSKLVDNPKPETPSAKKQNGISSESITFSLHFCDPRIHTFSMEGDSVVDRCYKLPSDIKCRIVAMHNEKFVDDLETRFKDLVFDTRRMNLDKDRPLIDHVLSMARNSAPKFLDLIFANNDKTSKREILMSCPKMSKLLRATVKRQLGPDMFEIHSEPLPETEEILKFIHPFESSYAILPMDWAENHEECVSVHPSRNPSPTMLSEISHEIDIESKTKPGIKGPTADKPKGNPSHVGGRDDEAAQEKFRAADYLVNSRGEGCLNPDRFRSMPSGGVLAHNREASEVFSVQHWMEEPGGFDEFDPDCLMRLVRNYELRAISFHFCIDMSKKEEVERKFKVMDLIEVVHPSSDQTICLGRIRKVLFPLIWIQLSTDCYTLLPYNSTNIYPHGWCEAHNHKLISLLPPRKRYAPRASSQCNSDAKRRKKAKISQENTSSDQSRDLKLSPWNEIYEKEHFDLGAIKDRQAGIDHILSEKSAYIEIFFNHKCFTGPSLSKSKICSLPQYVGPGPMRLVIEEVVTKVISVAYVPPRILNDLSSKSFEELLIERNLTNTVPVEFKAKYQKRVHRDTIPVCVSPEDVALYCECICEHIKCCYNLFGLKLYDGDDCPSHCRSLTKSNKFMKRATYYREKARQGEYLNQNNNENSGTNKKAQNTTNVDNGAANSRTTSRARYTGRGSSESASSSNLSCSDQTISRSSPAVNQNMATSNEMKENSISPEAWTVDDVSRYLDSCQLSIFKSYMKSEGIDGQALLLLDKATIEEHFQYHMKSEFTKDEVNRLYQIVESIKTNI